MYDFRIWVVTKMKRCGLRAGCSIIIYPLCKFNVFTSRYVGRKKLTGKQVSHFDAKPSLVLLLSDRLQVLFTSY